MPWNDSTERMTAPLNLSDIRKAVRYNSKDLGRCITRGTINQWAKWKPERNSTPGILSVDDRQRDNWGLRITKFTNISDLRAGYTSEWEYLAPRGIIAGAVPVDERFRMFDFCNPTPSSPGYNRNAKCFFRRSVSTFPTSYILGQGGLVFTAQWEPETQFESTAPASVRRSEIRITPSSAMSDTLADTYFGVILYHPNWQDVRVKTAATTVGGESYTSSVTFTDSDLQNFPTGVTVYPVFCVDSVPSMATSFPSGGVFALPMSPFTLDVLDPSTVVQLTANIEASYWRGRLSLYGDIGMVTSGAFNTVSGVSYNVYSATSMSDKTGAQIGATQTYQTVLTPSTTLEVDYSIMTERPDYVRIVISGYVGGSTQVTLDFNIGVPETPPQNLVT